LFTLVWLAIIVGITYAKNGTRNPRAGQNQLKSLSSLDSILLESKAYVGELILDIENFGSELFDNV